MPDRFIRESICVSDTLNQLSDFEERFWHRLIVNCDDFGRFDARPAVLKGKLFPLMDGKTKKDMADALNKLASVGLVELYEVDGKPFLHVVKWSKYQRTRAKYSKYPAPDSENSIMKSSDSTCCQETPNVPDLRPTICDLRPTTYGGDTRARDPAIAAVMTAYMDKINPTPSEQSLDELKFYVGQMGAECCLRAFDIALDEKKTTWSYIRAILSTKLSQGVKCLADWDEAEKKHKREKGTKTGRKGAFDAQPTLEKIQENNDWMDSFLEEQRRKDDKK